MSNRWSWRPRTTKFAPAPASATPRSFAPLSAGPTGMILSARFRPTPIETAFVMAETLAPRDLEETTGPFEESGDRPFSVVWIDCLAHGRKFGRALATRGEFLERRAPPPARDPLRPAGSARPARPGRQRRPASLLDGVCIGLFNELYYRCGRERAVHFDPFFFPWTESGPGTAFTAGRDSCNISACCPSTKARVDQFVCRRPRQERY